MCLFIGAGDPANGAIAIYSRRGADFKKSDLAGLPVASIAGYTAIRQFSSPNYATAVSESQVLDTRTTLLWKPNIFTNATNNKIVLPFYNSDIDNKPVRIVIEGITKDGRLAHYEQVIKN